MSLRTSARAPVRGRGRVVRRGARGGASGWAIGSRVVPATAVPEELVNQVSFYNFDIFSSIINSGVMLNSVTSFK